MTLFSLILFSVLPSSTTALNGITMRRMSGQNIETTVIASRQCDSQGLGIGFDMTPESCLAAALNRPDVCAPMIMHSPSLNDVWDCRCCAAGDSGHNAHPLWDIHVAGGACLCSDGTSLEGDVCFANDCSTCSGQCADEWLSVEQIATNMLEPTFSAVELGCTGAEKYSPASVDAAVTLTDLMRDRYPSFMVALRNEDLRNRAVNALKQCPPDNTPTCASLVRTALQNVLLLTDGNADRVFEAGSWKRRLYNELRVFVVDAEFLNDNSLEQTFRFLSQLPERLMREGLTAGFGDAITVTLRDSLNCGAIYQATERAFNVFSLQVGDGAEDAFGDNVETSFIGDLYMTVLRHEAAHQFDRVRFGDPVLRARYDDLFGATTTSGNVDNWMRLGAGANEFFLGAPQEIYASLMGNQYTMASTTQLELALTRLERQGLSLPLAWFLHTVELFSGGGDTSVFYLEDPPRSGIHKSEVVRLERNSEGRIISIQREDPFVTHRFGFADRQIGDRTLSVPVGHKLVDSVPPLSCGGFACAKYYDNIGGTRVINLHDAPNFPNNPDEETALSSLSTERNRANNYGVMVEAWIQAPTTGDYVFSTNSDDESEVWVMPQPGVFGTSENMVKVVELIGCCRTETGTVTIPMLAGRSYFVRGFMKEGAGGDNFDIGFVNTDTQVNILPIGSAQIATDRVDPLSCGALACASYYDNISGLDVEDLTSAPSFPNNPDEVTILSSLSTQRNRAENYGVMVEAWIKAPTTGDYVFSTNSDDASAVFVAPEAGVLGTDENMVKVVELRGCCRTVTGTVTIPMIAGRSYFLRGFMKEAFRGDNFDIGFTNTRTGQNIFPIGSAEIAMTPALTGATGQDNNSVLLAYWDNGFCGPEGDDHNWGICGQTARQCPEEIVTSECASRAAKLISFRENLFIDGCSYVYYAEYRCVPEYTTVGRGICVSGFVAGEPSGSEAECRAQCDSEDNCGAYCYDTKIGTQNGQWDCFRYSECTATTLGLFGDSVDAYRCLAKPAAEGQRRLEMTAPAAEAAPKASLLQRLLAGGL